MHELLRQVVAELKGSWRFRWLAVSAAWVACLLGWLVVYSLPDSYESEAMVYVDTSSALRPLLEKMTIGSDVLDRVELVTTAMLGRPLLEKVARETDLHLRATSREEMDNLIFGLRERIDILNNPRTDPNLYIIRYRDEDPAAAQSVVSSMLNIFVEDSLGANRLDTQKAQEFLREELKKLEIDLERSEQELASFKKENVGLMPGDGGGYFERLRVAGDELESTQADLRTARRKQEALRRQLSGEQPTLNSSTGVRSGVDQRISENQTRLEELQLRFTDRHPDVIAIKQTLDQLREQKRTQLAQLGDGDGSGIASDNPVFQNIQIELTNVSVEIETLLEQEATRQRKAVQLRNQIDILPQVEAELSRLTRDYAVQEAQYQSLLQKLDVAELSESAEQSEEIQFRIIDPPFVPDQPAAPNRPVLLFGVFVVALGFGGALAFLLNQLRPVFNDATALRAVTGLPVLGVITGLRTANRRLRRVRELSLIGVAFGALCAVFVAVFLFNESGGALVRSLM